MTDFSKIDETELPSKKAFYSYLYEEDVRQEEYRRGSKAYNPRWHIANDTDKPWVVSVYQWESNSSSHVAFPRSHHPENSSTTSKLSCDSTKETQKLVDGFHPIEKY